MISVCVQTSSRHEIAFLYLFVLLGLARKVALQSCSLAAWQCGSEAQVKVGHDG